MTIVRELFDLAVFDAAIFGGTGATKFIPDQSRVEGSFTVTINGSATRLQERGTFTETDPILVALDNAGIAYEDPAFDATTGVPTGRIRLIGSGSCRFAAVNGKPSYLPMGEWLTPSASVLEALDHAAVAYELEYRAAV